MVRLHASCPCALLFVALFVLQLTAASVPAERPTIGLALGGGGANGLAHVVILELLDELDVQPDLIAGTSIGAIMGALYASGFSGKDIRALIDDVIAQETDGWRELLLDRKILRWIEFVDPSMGRGGLIRGDKFVSFLNDAIEMDTFEELPIPLKVVATSIKTGEQVVLDSGDIGPAVQASMAIPGLFEPVVIDGRPLVDGGLVNPVPFDLLLDECDFVIAVNVIGHLDQEKDPSLIDAMVNSTRIFQRSLLREKKKHREPDIFIDTQIKDIKVLQFHKAENIYGQAGDAVEELRQALQAKLGLEPEE